MLDWALLCLKLVLINKSLSKTYLLILDELLNVWLTMSGNRNGGLTTRTMPNDKTRPNVILYSLNRFPRNMAEKIMVNIGLLYTTVSASPIGIAVTAAKHRIMTIPAQKPWKKKNEDFENLNWQQRKSWVPLYEGFYISYKVLQFFDIYNCNKVIHLIYWNFSKYELNL